MIQNRRRNANKTIIIIEAKIKNLISLAYLFKNPIVSKNLPLTDVAYEKCPKVW